MINKRSLENLPGILNEAASLLVFAMYETEDQTNVANIMEKLREYAIMIEGMPNGD